VDLSAILWVSHAVDFINDVAFTKLFAKSIIPGYVIVLEIEISLSVCGESEA